MYALYRVPSSYIWCWVSTTSLIYIYRGRGKMKTHFFTIIVKMCFDYGFINKIEPITNQSLMGISSQGYLLLSVFIHRIHIQNTHLEVLQTTSTHYLIPIFLPRWQAEHPHCVHGTRVSPLFMTNHAHCVILAFWKWILKMDGSEISKCTPSSISSEATKKYIPRFSGIFICTPNLEILVISPDTAIEIHVKKVFKW